MRALSFGLRDAMRLGAPFSRLRRDRDPVGNAARIGWSKAGFAPRLRRAGVAKSSMGRSSFGAPAIALCLVFGLAQTDPVSAAGPIPEHLIGMMRSLIGQVEDADFPNARIREKVDGILDRSRIRSWRGTQPSADDFSAEVASLLGLDYARPDHRKIVSELLSATDESEQRRAISGIDSSGDTPSPAEGEATGDDDALKTLQDYRTLTAGKLEGLERGATIEVGESGERLTLEWDPEAASFSARFDLGAGQDEVYLHGGVAARREGDRLRYEISRDPSPVTVVDEEKRRQIYPKVFGVWVDGKGARWTMSGLIDPANDDATARAADARRKELSALETRLARLKEEKVHIWINPETGEETIQKKFKRLGEPFVYDRDRSNDFNKQPIEDLEHKIADLEQADKRLPVDKYDPIRSRQSRSNKQAGPISISVSEPGGYAYRYESAEYDGKRITARRTLADPQDIKGLPGRIISELVESWSPPEWIELRARYHPRTDSLSLSGERWRLHVTYDPNGDGVDSIHTPDPAALTLKREAVTVGNLPEPDSGSEIRTASGAGENDLP